MELTKGLNTDARWNKVPKGSWIAAKNILLSKGFRSICNEGGFTPQFDSLYGVIMGVIPTQTKTIYFTLNDVGVSSILSCPNEDLGTFSLIANDAFLNFSLQHPIEGIYKINNLGEIIVVWTDNCNEIRYLNIDNPPITIDANNILLFPNVVNPKYVPTIQDNLGNLTVGNYNFTSRYISKTEITTDWLDITKPIFITTSDISVGYNQFSGAATEISNKAIELTITNIDTNYRYLEIGVISTIGQIKTFKSVVKLIHNIVATIDNKGLYLYD